MSKDKRYTLAFVACLAIYASTMVWAGRFAGLDEVFFKSPGRQWAATGDLAAPELKGFLNLDPPIEQVWFVHPPGYPVVYGLFTMALGFGPRQCVLFDALIHAVLALLTYGVGCRFAKDLPRWCVFLAGLAVLPVGIFCRPDELAMCWGMLAIWTLLAPAPRWLHFLAAGVGLGLSLATSVAAGILLGFVVLVVLAMGSREGRSTIIQILFIGVTASAVFGVAIAPILREHPTAYLQYLAHATAHVRRGSFWESYFTGWEHEQFHRSIAFGCLLVGLGGLWGSMTWTQWLRWWLGPILAIGFLAALLPDKVYYTWFVGPWMMLAVAATGRSLPPRWPPLALRGLVLVLAIPYAIAIAPFLKNIAIMVSLPESQSLSVNIAKIREMIPPGSTVWTDDYWWALAEDHKVYDLYFGRPTGEEIDFIILGSDGSGDPARLRDVPEYLADYVANHFEPVSNNIDSRPIILLGRPIPHSASGFGVLVLKRRQESRPHG